MQMNGSRLPRYVHSKPHLYVVSCLASLLTMLVVLLPEANAQTSVNITTYHYDNMRTGWNNQEASLTPTNVKSSQFKLLASTPLDEQVDAQPLLLTNQTIMPPAPTPPSTQNVVYVASENNTIYAIDANSGKILLTKNLGKPVPMASLPGSCGNNSTVLGIASTPVIDPTGTPAGTPAIYVMAYTLVGASPV